MQKQTDFRERTFWADSKKILVFANEDSCYFKIFKTFFCSLVACFKIFWLLTVEKCFEKKKKILKSEQKLMGRERNGAESDWVENGLMPH